MDRILDAAEDLIRRDGETVFTMRALAQHAGVSPATPFNLFGSKGEILGQLIDRSINTLDRRDLPKDSVTALLVLGDLIVDEYSGNAEFYRPLFRSFAATTATAWQTAVSGWRYLLDEAVRNGHLRRRTRTELLAEHLEVVFVGSLSLWVREQVASDRWRAQLRFGVASSLLASASPKTNARLVRLTRAAEKELLLVSEERGAEDVDLRSVPVRISSGF